jgi:hypothetical protein
MNMGTIVLWLRELEREHESARKAAAHHGIDAAYWWRLKSGEVDNPSDEVLQKLGLEKVCTLYRARST